MDNPIVNLRERMRTGLRAFVLGQGVIDRSEMAWGHDEESFAPQEYGDYLFASNPVYACATLRAQLLASLPLRFYKRQKDGQAREVTSGKLYDLWNYVNPQWSPKRLVYMTELSRCMWGASFWMLERGENGAMAPREIWWARPDRVRVIPHPETYISGFIYQPDIGATEIRFDAGEVVWMPLPNAYDEFSGLSPLAAARLAADYHNAGMQSNKRLFDNGMQIGGTIAPKEDGVIWTQEQAEELEKQISKRFRGSDKAHKWMVMRQALAMTPAGLSPKDIEFLAGMKFSLEEVARAYKIPQDLIGGQRTYENVDAAMKAIWTICILPEADLIADDLNERFLPIFGDADYCEFDASGVMELQEDRTEIVDQMVKLAGIGVPLNPLLSEFMPQLKPTTGDGYPWGDTAYLPLTMVPAGQAGQFSEPEEAQDEEPRSRGVRVDFGSPDHERAWRLFIRRTEPNERAFAAFVADLFQRQRKSVLDRLNQRSAEDALDNPFDKADWTKRFRMEVRPLLLTIIAEMGADAISDLGLDIPFDDSQAQVIRFLTRRSQRFAQEVNDTTWDRLKKSLAEGMADGEGIPQLAERVDGVMGTRIRSDATTISRTEVIGASNGGTLLAWEQTEVVKRKQWLAAIDERTRETHVAAHGQIVGIDEDFVVGAGAGPAPGQIGVASEDVNCRCTMTAVLK